MAKAKYLRRKACGIVYHAVRAWIFHFRARNCPLLVRRVIDARWAESRLGAVARCVAATFECSRRW